MKPPAFWQRGGNRLPRILLSPVSLVWQFGGKIRKSLQRPFQAAVPVICVGNLTAGGAGKTPVVSRLAEIVAAQGQRPGILSRGYGGSLSGGDAILVQPDRHTVAEVGDEPMLHARHHPTVICTDRAAGARLLSQHCDVILMDDGFQNFGLVKDLSIIVIDAAEGLGNGAMVPAGPLREPLGPGLTRANAVIALGPGVLDSRIARSGLPVLRGRLEPLEDGTLSQRPLLGFCGIGRPEKFRDTLTGLGADLRSFRPYPDHHPYSEADWQKLVSEAESLSARLVTTEKDAVRLSADQRVQVLVVRVQVRMDQPEMLAGLVAAVTTPASDATPPNR